MLDNASPVHAIDIGQSGRLRQHVDFQMDEPNVRIHVVTQDLKVNKGNDASQISDLPSAAVLIVRLVLDEANVDVSEESFGGVLLDVEFVHEFSEDIAPVVNSESASPFWVPAAI